MRDSESREYVRTLVFAALLGVPVAFAAVLFQTLIHDVIHLVWDVIPDEFGWSQPSWWYVVLVPGFAGLLVAAAFDCRATAVTLRWRVSEQTRFPRFFWPASFPQRSRVWGSDSFSALKPR
jgi:hypothetical protein